MLRELLSIFKTSNPLQAMGENFARMLTLTYEMTVEAGEMEGYTRSAGPVKLSVAAVPGPVLRAIPFFGPVRVALLLATMQTPWRFRTKRNLWAYAGLAVVTRSSADYTFVAGRPVRRCRAPMTRGLNRNYNRVLKDVFKGAATAATGRPGPLQDFYHGMIARGMREELARVTLTRKLAAITLRLWKKGKRYDPTQLTMQAR